MRYALVCASVAIGACGGSGGQTPASAAQAAAVAYMVGTLDAIPRLELLVPVLLFPATRTAAGITFELDTPPGTYRFTIPLDCDGDGATDATITGTAVLTSDPTVGSQFESGFVAQADVTVTVGAITFTGALNLSFDASGSFLVSGTGTLNDPASNTTVTLAVAPAAPLHIKSASTEPDEQPNGCTYSIHGALAIASTSPGGIYTAQWNFDRTSLLIQVTGARFTPAGASEQALADTQFSAAVCAGANGATIQDWLGTWDLDWFCVPARTGSATLTITLIDADTVHVVSEDPPGSGLTTAFNADADPGNPRILRAEVLATDAGGDFESDLVWILAPDGASFSQQTEFFYLSGALAGTGGNCGGTATR